MTVMPVVVVAGVREQRPRRDEPHLWEMRS